MEFDGSHFHWNKNDDKTHKFAIFFFASRKPWDNHNAKRTNEQKSEWLNARARANESNTHTHAHMYYAKQFIYVSLK